MHFMFGGNALTQHFSLTFFLFLLLQHNFFPLRLRQQTSTTKLRYLQGTHHVHNMFYLLWHFIM